MFLVVITLCGCLYLLLKHKTDILVSQIKRRTNFKVMADSFLKFLPTVYIIDEKMYIGANLLKRPCNMGTLCCRVRRGAKTIKISLCSVYDGQP